MAEDGDRQVEDSRYPGMIFRVTRHVGDPEEYRRIRDRIGAALDQGANMVLPSDVEVIRPNHQLTPETEKLLGRLLNPQTLLERLAVAALKGDDAAALALVDRVKEELGGG